MPDDAPLRTARPVAQVRIVLDDPGDGPDAPAHDISAAAGWGDTLFLGADECAGIEVLDLAGEHFTEHRRIALGDCFDLPDGSEEMDIEGLAIDDGWLWVVGSHSLTRRKPKSGKPLDAQALERLAGLKDNDNRMFLGRLPLVESAPRRWSAAPDGAQGRKPQMLPINGKGSHLYRRLKKDPLLAPFCALPAKENGVLDQGLKVRDGGLKLDGPLAKSFLDLDGLGIRDLKRRGADMLILAGPTMKLDGPTHIYVWRDWQAASASDDRLHRPERILDLPHGRACDHPEALALAGGHGDDTLLVVCDSPGRDRLAGGAVLADVFRLPPV
jgi:hypothetical protein